MASKKNKGKKKKSGSGKPLLIFLGVTAIGVAGFVGYRYLNKRRQLVNTNTNTAVTTAILPKRTTIKRKWVDDSFPLGFNSITQTGSSGPRVLQLQQKLNLKFQAALTADGKFGPMTQTALTSNGFPALINESNFNKIVDSEATVVLNPMKIATDLWNSSNKGNYAQTMSNLRMIKNVKDYQSVSTFFKIFRDSNLHGHTIVTHLLDFTFLEDENRDQYKEDFKKEFYRIGLKKGADDKWSLSGLGIPSRIVTIKDTYVKDSGGNIITVKKNTLLGTSLHTSAGMTWFKAIDGSMACVPSGHFKYQ